MSLPLPLRDRSESEFFGGTRPATSIVQVSRPIAPEMLVEIDLLFSGVSQ